MIHLDWAAAFAGMKLGYRYRRASAGDDKRRIGMLNGHLHLFVDGFSPIFLVSVPTTDLLANDWVLA